MSPASWGWVVLACPLAGTLLIALGWRVLGGRTSGWLASLAILGSFVAAILALLGLLDLPEDQRAVSENAFTYLDTVGIDVGLGILVDPLSVFMCLVVSGVSFLIHVYSVSYLASDHGYRRYFAYLNFFVFSMLLLVLANNFVLLTVGWAFVGAASYLLISYWYRRTTATAAGIKAFVINVIGDVGLVIAAFLLFSQTGELSYAGVFEAVGEEFQRNEGILVAACLMLLVGAFAKSAQIPLHTWLADAMEGPTPVSALIHAATMVTAGVYLIARTHPLFEQAPAAADVGAIIGAATLLYAATVALVITDLKRIIAFSTISQIGYMVLGVCAFAYGAGLFHLMTHAFFKALLFMGAGSVIAAMAGQQSIDRMGGFRRAMPFTFVTFTIGALALAGFPLFSGFFSKDEVLAYAIDRGGLYLVLGIAGYVGAFLTAFYAFRMVFRVFFGEPVAEARSLEQGELAHGAHENPLTGEPEDTGVGYPGPDHHIAERAFPMSFAMGILAVLAIVGGFVGIPEVTDTLEHFLEPTFEESRFIEESPSAGAEILGLVIGGVISVAGIALAFLLYMRRPGRTAALAERRPALNRFLARRWYFDEIYDVLVVKPTAAIGRFGQRFVERGIIQGLLVGGPTELVRGGSFLARAIQTGVLRIYAGVLLLGVGGLVLYFLLASI